MKWKRCLELGCYASRDLLASMSLSLGTVSQPSFELGCSALECAQILGNIISGPLNKRTGQNVPFTKTSWNGNGVLNLREAQIRDPL